MKKTREHILRHIRKYSLGVLIFIVVGFYIFLPKFPSFVRDSIKFQDLPVAVLVNDTELANDQSAFVPTETLRPTFNIKVEELAEIQAARLDGMDVLSSTAFTKKLDGNDIEFSPIFLLTPGEHTLEIVLDGEEVDFKFTLNLRVGFDTSIKKSEFFVIPDSTEKNHPDNWYIKGSKLRLDSLNEPPLASIAFLYPFSDIDLTFTFKPTGEVTNLVFYFLERGRSIVIGNGNSSRITLLRGAEEKYEGTPFEIRAGEEYKARVVRKGNEYNLYLASSTGEWQQVLNYEDSQDFSTESDSVGFSVWPGGEGIEIDNLSFFSSEP